MKLTRRSPMDYRQDSADIEFSINQMKSSLAHQTSKLEMWMVILRHASPSPPEGEIN
jgi:hypothetical protein